MEITLVSLALNGACGIVMWYMSRTADANDKRISKLETDLGKALMKEDFKEFKEELFKRLDRIEAKNG
jgi:hypothetical protein